MPYKDITNQYKKKKHYRIKKQQYFIGNNGIKYKVDNKHVVLEPTQREIEVSKILGRIIGGRVNIIPKINEPEGIKTPDYIIHNEKFDLKEISGKGKNTLDNAIRKQEKQASNFIFDISNTNMSKIEIIRQVKNIYNSKHREWVNKIIVVRNYEVLKFYDRDK